MTTLNHGPIFMTEDDVKPLLTWLDVVEAVEQALRSVVAMPPAAAGADASVNHDWPVSVQNPRSFTATHDSTGVLLTMPAFVGNYKLPNAIDSHCTTARTLNTLGCKLVTAFENNSIRTPAIPKILANVVLFNVTTGKLDAVVEATEITAVRTAAASIVATRYLYFNRLTDAEKSTRKILAIVGCGTQGRSHAIGMLCTFHFDEIILFNRTVTRTMVLAKELSHMLDKFVNRNLRIGVAQSPQECVQNADVVVTATNSATPLVQQGWAKANAHFNAIGAGTTSHNSELAMEIYQHSAVYVEFYAGADRELKPIRDHITGEVGEVINNLKTVPTGSQTVYQSMGMGVEDCAVTQMVVEKYRLQQNCVN